METVKTGEERGVDGVCCVGVVESWARPCVRACMRARVQLGGRGWKKPHSLFSPVSLFVPYSKVEQVSEEAVALRLDLERHTHRERRRAAEEADRADLLEGRISSAAWAAAADADVAAEGAIRNSKRILEETFATGAAVLGAMGGQRERLKV